MFILSPILFIVFFLFFIVIAEEKEGKNSKNTKFTSFNNQKSFARKIVSEISKEISEGKGTDNHSEYDAEESDKYSFSSKRNDLHEYEIPPLAKFQSKMSNKQKLGATRWEIKKSEDKLADEDELLHSKLSRESRDDEKEWF